MAPCPPDHALPEGRPTLGSAALGANLHYLGLDPIWVRFSVTRGENLLSDTNVFREEQTEKLLECTMMAKILNKHNEINTDVFFLAPAKKKKKKSPQNIMSPPKDTSKNIHSHFSYNSPKMRTTQVSINRKTDKLWFIRKMECNSTMLTHAVNLADFTLNIF